MRCVHAAEMLASHLSIHRGGEDRGANGADQSGGDPGLERSPERVTVAFLVGGAAAQRGDTVAMWLTKEAVRLAMPGHAEAVACDGCPPLSRLSRAVRRGRRRASHRSAPSAFNARKLTESALAADARLVGATPTFERVSGDDNADPSSATRLTPPAARSRFEVPPPREARAPTGGRRVHRRHR